MRKCPYCKSEHITSTFNGYRCNDCGEDFEADERQERIRTVLVELVDELAGPLDDEARLSALLEIARVCIEMRNSMEDGDAYGMD